MKPHNPNHHYKVTGVLKNGRRFKPMFFDNFHSANCINLWNGTVWERNGNKWTRIVRKVN